MKTEATPEVYKPTPEETEAWEKSKAEAKARSDARTSDPEYQENIRLLREKIKNSDWKPVNLRAALSWSDDE